MRFIAALILSVAVVSPAAAVMKQMPGSRGSSPMVMPVMRTVSIERANEIKNAAGQELTRNIDPNTEKGRMELARIEAGFNPAAASEITDQVDKVLFQYFSDDDSAESYRALAASIGEFVNAYHNLLSGTQVLKLTQFADEARQAAGDRLMTSANGIAQQLGKGRAAEDVAGAESKPQPLGRPLGDVLRKMKKAQPVDVKITNAMVDMEKGQEPEKGFNWFMVMIYSGAVLIMGAFGWFVLYNWMILGPAGIMVLAAGIAGGLALLGRVIGQEKFPKTAGLINATIVGMAPLFTYGLLAALGKAPGSYHEYYTRIDLGWVLIEFVTIAAAAAMAFFGKAKSAMVAFPAAIAAWFLSMDLARAFTNDSMMNWSVTHAWFSVMSGMVMMAASRMIEKFTKIDYPFWGYLAGLLAFTGGLMSLPANGELGRLMFAAVHVALIGGGVYLKRKTFAVFGALGVLGYISHLAVLFAAELSFPLALAFFGTILIISAVLIQKNMAAIKAWIKGHLEQATA